jgi:restriction endonuclease S subunit
MAVWSQVTLSKLQHGFRIDSEFYKTDYLKNDLILDKYDHILLGCLGKVTDGEHGSVRFLNDGIKYLTAENIKNGYVDIEKIRFVDEEVDERNARARVEVDDIFISIKGTLGQVAIAEDWLLPANMNRDVAIVKLYNGTNFDKLFVALFLQTKYGSYQLAREGSGAVQQMITLGRLREVKIPIVSEKLQKTIASQYKQALNLRNRSQSLYTQAQQLLEQELGIDKLAFKKPVGYEAQFSEIVSKSKFSSYFFQPKYEQLVKLIESKSDNLSSVIKSYSSGFAFSKDHIAKEPTHYPLIKIQNIAESNIDISNVDFVNEAGRISAKNEIACVGDLLIGMSGTIGITGIVDDSASGAMINQRILRINPIDTMLKEYLSIVLNSIIGKMQFERVGTGGVQTNISAKDMLKVLIPRIGEKEQKISHLVIQAKQAKRESHHLFEKAKTRVEQLIEQAAEKP